MDESTANHLPSSEQPHFIALPNLPFRPWLRLAHIASTSVEHSGGKAPLRSLRDFEIILQLEHSNWIWSQSEMGSIEIGAGEVAFIPPGYAHAWGTQSGTHLAVHFDLHAQRDLSPFEHIRLLEGTALRRPLSVRPEFHLHDIQSTSDASRDDLVVPLVTAVRAPAVWQERLHALVELYQRRTHHGTRGQLLAGETLLWAMRTLEEDSRHVPELGVNERNLLAFLARWEETMHKEAARTPGVSRLARQLNVSETGLRELFHRVTGRSPRTYFEERRLERAARTLLETSRSVADVARQAGYDDPYHFSRVFKRVTGHSPRRYRQQSRAPAEIVAGVMPSVTTAEADP
jgi:AraC-like DNA-binding protein